MMNTRPDEVGTERNLPCPPPVRKLQSWKPRSVRLATQQRQVFFSPGHLGEIVAAIYRNG